jgi:predicted acylesterase/phospholipase RssA
LRSRLAVIGLLASGVLGCASEAPVRPDRSSAELVAARDVSDARAAQEQRAVTVQLLLRIKREYDEFSAGRAPAPPVVNVLILSGGGDWGAFGSAFLKGWRGVPAGPMALPEFDVVTGVSTGALIAPFAFLGDQASIDTVVDMYRHPVEDLVKRRSWYALISGASSYAEVPGLERQLRAALDTDRLQRIVAAGEQGRVLAVNLTNIDTQEMHVWNVVEEARQALKTGSTEHIDQVLLASSAIPGAFPPREIDGVMFVDGGLTGNILIGGPQARPEDETFVANWVARYPTTPLPKIRYWIIFNNEVRWPPAVVPHKMMSVLSASMTASTRSATINCMRLLMLQANLAHFKYHADIEVRMVAVPDGWVPPKPGTFVAESMNALADMGEKMGADPASWRTSLPEQSKLSATGPAQ